MICFLDRDGIFNVDYGYVGSIDRFTWNKPIFEILLYLKRLGYRFVLVTNQSGIGRGYYSLSDFYGLTFYILNYLFDNYSIDLEVNYCPHHPSFGCYCRKPSPGMLLRYDIGEHDIMIGDNVSDMQAACSAGVKHRWLVSDKPSGPYTHTSNQLDSLYKALLQGQLIRTSIP